jgi:hypothetical protein
MRCLSVIILSILLSVILSCKSKQDPLQDSFVNPPDSAKPRIYWWWLYNRVDKAGITHDLEEFRDKGISGVNLICTGGYAGKEALPGVKFLGPEWRELFRHAVREAKRLDIEIGFNLAGGWTMMGPWVTPDKAMKKVVHKEIVVTGPMKFSQMLPQPETIDGYYHDILVQAIRLEGMIIHLPTGKQNEVNEADSVVRRLTSMNPIGSESIIDITGLLTSGGKLEWDVPEGKWVILRSGYTLTGHPWSRWYAYPGGDTFEGGEGLEIDYLSKAALDDHFEHLGKTVIEEALKAKGKLAYLWSDSWECGKLSWTQDFPDQFRRFRGYDLKPYMPVLAGYTIENKQISERFLDDFNSTIQDCIAENFYGHFMELCHDRGMKVGNEAGGPNDIPYQDVLKNLGRCDIPAGEFWVRRYHNSSAGYDTNRSLRLNLKQTASAAHIYGKKEAQAEAFTQMETDATHWTFGPAGLKPYANDAFCEGINRFMLHQSTCQPPSDGVPGYEFCAGQHFTPNITWWEQSKEFFTYLSRCQYMLQQGKFVGDVCFYLGERPPVLVPPKYIVPSLGTGYDCDYVNSEVLLKRMSVKNGRVVLPDGMSYRLLVLQNCTSVSPSICNKVSEYQKLPVSTVPSTAMSVEVIEKIRKLIFDGATVVGPPPENSAGLKNYPECDDKVHSIASEIWGDLNGVTNTERMYGKGRVIWGRTPREILLADGLKPDFVFDRQDVQPEEFDYIHRTIKGTDIYFVINRSDKFKTREFTFRVTGKQPELWDAVSGRIRDAYAFRQENGCTTLPLEFDSFGSCFIVFRKSIRRNKAEAGIYNYEKFTEIENISGSWNVRFDTSLGAPSEAEFPTLMNWINRPEEGIKYYSGKATYIKSFKLISFPDSNKDLKEGTDRIFLDLGDVKEVAEVRLNGRNLGVMWCPPWRVEVTDAIKSGNNNLEIDIVNLWANRVIGDLGQPPEKRITKTHDRFRFDMLRVITPLPDAGLIGPVRLLRTIN